MGSLAISYFVNTPVDYSLNLSITMFTLSDKFLEMDFMIERV
jgi:hypothetical protein